MTTTEKGWTDLTNTSDMDGAVQINSAVHHLEGLVDARVPLSSNLPSSGNWPGRMIFVEYNDALYINPAGDANWKIIATPSQPRRYHDLLTAGSIGNGTSLGSRAISALPFTTRLIVSLEGTVGFGGSAGNTYGVQINNSAGTKTEPTNYTPQQVNSGQWMAYARRVYIDLPANTACTISFVTSASSNGYYRLLAETTILVLGEFA